MAISSNGGLVVTGSTDKAIRMFDVVTKQLIFEYENAHSGKAIATLSIVVTLFLDHITSIVISTNDKWIVSASKDKSIKVYSLRRKQQMHHFQGMHEGSTILALNNLLILLDGILSVAIAGNGSFIVSGSADKSIKILSLRTKQDLHHFKDAHMGISAFNFIVHLNCS